MDIVRLITAAAIHGVVARSSIQQISYRDIRTTQRVLETENIVVPVQYVVARVAIQRVIREEHERWHRARRIKGEFVAATQCIVPRSAVYVVWKVVAFQDVCSARSVDCRHVAPVALRKCSGRAQCSTRSLL